ncbi:hypothetical protein N1851_015868 [Merluccius polli]|uniref:Uncharacterized protein n=1 Tax=Merluccius polli TaxID=89951 RepID=A0AA47P002_MERPO|nr:hypothetical protein N1851_015868 [Merluccius polli]
MEVIESLDTSLIPLMPSGASLAIRGPVKLLRFDRGTNFSVRCMQGAQDSSPTSTAVLWRSSLLDPRLQMDIQSSPRLTHGRLMGEDDLAWHEGSWTLCSYS